jgi:hypothetical protein
MFSLPLPVAQALLVVLQLVWIVLPMLTALLFLAPVIGLLLWQTRARES